MRRKVFLLVAVISFKNTIGQHPVPLYESEAYVSALA
jgi:hypothetical protein